MFNLVILIILNLVDLGILRIHIDTTSVSVTGEYDYDFSTRLIRLIRGHSKDHRDDLKQFVIALSTDQRGIPTHMEALSGNESDIKTLLGVISRIRESIDLDKTVYHIADSVFYIAENLTTLGSHCYWISRVPETILEAKTAYPRMLYGSLVLILDICVAPIQVGSSTFRVGKVSANVIKYNDSC